MPPELTSSVNGAKQAVSASPAVSLAALRNSLSIIRTGFCSGPISTRLNRLTRIFSLARNSRQIFPLCRQLPETGTLDDLQGGITR
jgi:hypothetical protein